MSLYAIIRPSASVLAAMVRLKYLYCTEPQRTTVTDYLDTTENGTNQFC
jgi:hypothetical protein